MDEKHISVLDVLVHQMIILDQYEGRDVGYSLGVKPYRIGISGEDTQFCWFVSLLRYNIQLEFSIRSISDIQWVFSIDECVACQLVLNKAPIFINSGLCCGSHDGIYHVHYAGIALFRLVVDRLCM